VSLNQTLPDRERDGVRAVFRAPSVRSAAFSCVPSRPNDASRRTPRRKDGYGAVVVVSEEEAGSVTVMVLAGCVTVTVWAGGAAEVTV
jgi:hypothetical protein